LEKIKSAFSIGDLESLTGISAHTIRIWEKRYHLLSPCRSDTNIRKYNNDDLCKLLNVALLQKHGLKISKIACLSDQEIERKINELTAGEKDYYQTCINQFKNAMFQFDDMLFEETCKRIIRKHSFEALFIRVFFPLMKELGILWQTKSISPAHEHFITNLIKQKLYSEIDRLGFPEEDAQEPLSYVIFLPHNEFHELGSLFLQFLLKQKGKHTINLGASIEAKDLVSLRESIQADIVYISWWTIFPESHQIDQYLSFFQQHILRPIDKLLVTGPMVEGQIVDSSLNQVHLFSNPAALVDFLNISIHQA
jgi:DNA-binding transcriptional MerR regulator